MRDPSTEPDDDFPEELELEALALNELDPQRRRTAFGDLCARYPEHVPIIEALSGLSGLEGTPDGPPPDAETIERIGPYRVLRVIGEGGMGRVFLGRRDGDDRDVALKVIRGEMTSGDVVRRFQREAKVLRELRHDGIARLLESGTATVAYAGGTKTRMPFLAMEYVDGEDLLTFAERRALDARSRVRLMVRVCEGMAYAHQRGVVHRDIKPGNVLVADDGDAGRPKVLDFGIARAGTAHGDSLSLTMTGQRGLLGTAPYMSPEQVLGGAKHLDARSDVYSLGVVLFELLTGRLPYSLDSQSLPEIARIIRDEQPTSLGSLDTRYRGSPIETIVAKALEKQPERRYADAGALGADLTNFVSDRPIVATRVGVVRRAVRFTRRHRVLVSTATGTLLALIAGLVVSIRFALGEARASAQASASAYRASVAAAAAALNDHDVAMARRSLAAAPERLRGWEWRVLTARLDESLASVRFALPPSVRLNRASLCFGPQGDVYALYGQGDAPRTLCAVRLRDGAPAVERVLDDVLAWPAFDSSGARVAVSPADREPETFATSGHAFAESALRSGGVNIVASGVPGRFVDVGLGDRVRLCGPEGVTETVELAEGVGDVYAITASERRRWLAVLRGTVAWFARIENGAVPVRIAATAGQQARCLAASPDGAWLAVGGEDGTLVLWEIPERAPPRPVRRLFGHVDAVHAVAFDAGSARLASGGDDTTVRVWAVDDGAPLGVNVGHASSVRAVAFDADGARLASLEGDGTLRLWSAVADPRVVAHPRTVQGLELYDGILYTAAFDGHVRLFDALSLEPIAQWGPVVPGQYLVDMRMTADGGALLLATAGLQRLDARGGGRARALDAPHADVRAVPSPDGRRVAVCSQEVVQLRAADSWELLATRRLAQTRFRSAAFTADGTRLLVPERGGAVRVLDARDLRPVDTLEVRDVAVLGFDPPGHRLATAHFGGVVRVWEWPSRAPALELVGHSWLVTDVAFSPDGTRIATAGRDRTARIWDARTGDEIVALADHRDFVGRLRFSADGERLYTASGDWSVRVWDARTRAERLALRAEYRAFAAAHEEAAAALLAANPTATAEALSGWPSFDARQRQIARQLVLRARSR